MAPIGYLEPWEKLNHEKNKKLKILCQAPFKAWTRQKHKSEPSPGTSFGWQLMKFTYYKVLNYKNFMNLALFVSFSRHLKNI